jgi:hypothetical protein
MSDANFDYEDEAVEDQPQPKNPVRARMRELEAENKRKDELLAQASQAQRELAFLKAGVNPENPMAKYFIKGYEGDLEVEAIRKAAEEANLIQSNARQQQVAQERGAWGRIGAASTAGEGGEQPVDFVDRIKKARNPNEVMHLLAQAKEAENTN